MKNIVIIGAGPAGMMAAVQASAADNKVILLEKKDRPGRKLMITGKGRCNITNTADLSGFMKNIPGNGKFLYSAFKNFFNEDVIDFFQQIGVPTKVERGGRVFPQSDKAADVVKALTDKMYDCQVEMRFNTDVEKIISHDGKIKGVKIKDDVIEADAVVLAAGGASYPVTGSDGSGAKLAREAGHNIISLQPALVPLVSDDEWVKSLQGLSLRNVRVSVFTDEKKSAEMFGEMMFTHFGVTGPIVLSLSRQIVLSLAEKKKVYLAVNLKPALTPEQLNARIQRDFKKYTRKQVKNAMIDLLPHRLIPIVLDLAYIDGDKSVDEITKKERIHLTETLQKLPFDIEKARPLPEAIVTCGGVNVKEIDPKTMQSKLLEGLFFAGEVTDIDGYTGGFNLQAAFSMGYTAGIMAGKQ
ncbi:BaiN/RdsA family NAD(P)/FAD-dependent oxidoreductase [Pectinatus haikarae]|uniref:Rossmann fold flavoprotein n=1 Tax=Pectinatus haikarae TaxID=349096 RepID=A0ABT9Y7E8_9FIRM|nr:NAD(P)/FAD-dependent oxidoreductase [Pectinatus haikarae]MDQ0203747.1 putative Rossmann fold flavoprotein [Pectinatus haikarae]